MFGLLLMTGCATAQPRVFSYPNIRPDLLVIVSDPYSVDEICRIDSSGKRTKPGEQRHDDGSPITESEFIGGCYARWDNTIWISETRPLLIYHELAHAAGYTTQEADGIYFDRGK